MSRGLPDLSYLYPEGWGGGWIFRAGKEADGTACVTNWVGRDIAEQRAEEAEIRTGTPMRAFEHPDPSHMWAYKPAAVHTAVITGRLPYTPNPPAPSDPLLRSVSDGLIHGVTFNAVSAGLRDWNARREASGGESINLPLSCRDQIAETVIQVLTHRGLLKTAVT